MRINNKFILQDRAGLFLSETGQLVQDKIQAGRFNRRSAQRIAMEKYGETWADQVHLLELDIHEFRLINLAKARKKMTPRKRRHLTLASKYRSGGIQATENLVNLLLVLSEEGLDLPPEIKTLASKVSGDYRKSIRAWHKFHQQKSEQISKV